jgi:hypothetical protein
MIPLWIEELKMWWEVEKNMSYATSPFVKPTKRERLCFQNRDVGTMSCLEHSYIQQMGTTKASYYLSASQQYVLEAEPLRDSRSLSQMLPGVHTLVIPQVNGRSCDQSSWFCGYALNWKRFEMDSFVPYDSYCIHSTLGNSNPRSVPSNAFSKYNLLHS